MCAHRVVVKVKLNELPDGADGLSWKWFLECVGFDRTSYTILAGSLDRVAKLNAPAICFLLPKQEQTLLMKRAWRFTECCIQGLASHKKRSKCARYAHIGRVFVATNVA